MATNRARQGRQLRIKMKLFAITLLQRFKIRFCGSKNWVNILSYSQAAPFFAYTTHHQVPEMLHDGQWTPDVSGNLMPSICSWHTFWHVCTIRFQGLEDHNAPIHHSSYSSIHPIASNYWIHTIFFGCTGSVPCHLLVTMVYPWVTKVWLWGWEAREVAWGSEDPLFAQEITFFFPLIFFWCFGDNGRDSFFLRKKCWQEILAMSLFCLGGRGWFDKPCLDRTVNPCGLKGEAPLNVVKWRTPCHGFANPLGWPKDDRFHVWLDMISH